MAVHFISMIACMAQKKLPICMPAGWNPLQILGNSVLPEFFKNN
jgi:hypothetical protein